MPVEWRQPLEEKYLDFDYIADKIQKSCANDTSMGWIHKSPNVDFRFNPTVLVPTITEFLMTFVNQLANRWEFRVLKVSEFIESSTTHPYFQGLIKQKHELIRQVKEGLAHVDRAISDVELLAHDARRYREILKFFAEEDEHSLKAMFIDQVDVHLPEGVSLRSIAPRWPTIIADFQELSDKEYKVDKIMKKIEVNKAEAVVLATKVRLYKKWKDYFGKEVKDRYKRILERLHGRKASIEEYRNWIRPLIRKIMMMREVDDSYLMTHMNYPMGAGIPTALENIEYWAITKWEGTEPISPHKEPREIIVTSGTGVEKHGMGTARKGAVPKFKVEPYDDVVKQFIPEIEKLHGVKLDEKDVLKARRRLYTEFSPGVQVYAFLRIPVSIQIFKLATGQECEDVDFNHITLYFMTHNILLIKLLEIIAEEKKLDVYIDELLGKKVVGEEGIIKEIDELLKEEFPEIYGEKEEKKPKGFSKSIFDFKQSFKKSIRNFLWSLYKIFGFKLSFVHMGQYEPVKSQRVHYTYFRPFYREIFQRKIWKYVMQYYSGI